jgi:chaperone modulatory protein CbpM
MMQAPAVAALFPDLELVELTAWVEQSWVVPEADGTGGWVFQAIDVARVRLIYDLHRDLGLSEDMVTLVLALLDQVYELRGQLRAVTRAVDRLPESVRAQILTALERD